MFFQLNGKGLVGESGRLKMMLDLLAFDQEGDQQFVFMGQLATELAIAFALDDGFMRMIGSIMVAMTTMMVCPFVMMMGFGRNVMAKENMHLLMGGHNAARGNGQAETQAYE